ncbi:Gfo/Idh/MocA family protein [Paenibacillus arenilitoris]|uniref:Gfo/Idh/MocA family oxidoreductase n=1 Tax=Paenibacillus arenilitoris TaxID=2772299 RepID=A0A927CH77_9BACL|nr:Gfo/Idh/MocA family oxidoreductase [Paenibacillus arenilitoris]MBD2867480.1 Gfo/Idh/MocA family oxidoreductase [Paenibacillus arenilitoris]
MTIKHRVVVAGCGGMANTWVDYAKDREDTEIVGLVDIKEEFAKAMAERKALACPTFTDIAEAIRATGANLVFDVTIPASHYTIGTTAMELGCHVFGEKPLAETMGECAGIVRLSESTGKTHAVMQNRRFDPRIRAFRNLVAGGTIGKPGFIGADFFIGAHFGGFRDAMESPLLLDMAIHTFDQARFIAGVDPVSVYCHEFNPPGSWYEGNAMAICIYEMSDGSVFNYRGSWCAEGAPTSWEASWRVTGEHGTAIWDGHGAPFAEVVAGVDQTGKFIREYRRIDGELVEMRNTFHRGCLDDMFASLAEGRKPETDCGDNLYSMAMVLAALESAKTGRKVMIADFIREASGN